MRAYNREKNSAMSRYPPPPDYKSIEQQLWRENAKAVKDALSNRDKYLTLKIMTYSKNFGYPVEEIIRKIVNDEMFAAHFAKAPKNQGIHEKVAAEWLEKLESVSDFRVLPKGGSGALFVTSDGNVEHWNKKGKPPTKSVDFTWQAGRTTFYASHKYTAQEGGAQGSAHKEMIDILKLFQNCPDETCVFITIVDGEFYTEKRMKELLRHTRSSHPKSYATPIAGVPVILEQHC